MAKSVAAAHRLDTIKAFDLDAAWDDARVGLGHWNVWERAAIVTDVDPNVRLAVGFRP